MLQDGSQAPLGSSLDDPKVQAGLITAALISGFSKGGPGPAASTLPGNLLEMHMLGPNCRSTESETLGLGSAICALTSPPPGHFDAHSSFRGLPCSDGKESTCNVGDLGSIPELGRSPGEGIATHSSILAWRILMDRVAWWATVHCITKSDTTEQLSTAQHVYRYL